MRTMSDEMTQVIDRVLGKSGGRRIFMFGILCILITSIVNSNKSSPTAVALAVLGLLLMIRGYSDYSEELNEKQKDEEYSNSRIFILICSYLRV
jgi:hypothetical protein